MLSESQLAWDIDINFILQNFTSTPSGKLLIDSFTSTVSLSLSFDLKHVILHLQNAAKFATNNFNKSIDRI